MGKRRSVGMRIDHPSDIFGRPGQLVKISVVFRARDLFSTEGYGKYQAQTREGVWVVSFISFIFLFLQRHGRGQQQTAIREMASTDMQGECERRNIDIGD